MNQRQTTGCRCAVGECASPALRFAHLHTVAELLSKHIHLQASLDEAQLQAKELQDWLDGLASVASKAQPQLNSDIAGVEGVQGCTRGAEARRVGAVLGAQARVLAQGAEAAQHLLTLGEFAELHLRSTAQHQQFAIVGS